MAGSPPGPLRSAAPWLLVLGTVAALVLLSVRALAPPPSRGRGASADRFSEARAREVVRRLTEDIGRRVNGTEGHARAVDFLAAELRTIPGVEVEVQQAAGTHVYVNPLLPHVPFVYRTTNVLGRLPGKTKDAILLDAHFDTRPDSVGAADDAAGVACALEVLRGLARQAPLDRSIVVNLNGAEEVGMLGAVAFLQHAWARDVRAYVYLEALPGGRAVLAGAGPGNPWLAQTYAREVADPLGNVLAQELTQSGLLPFFGDFTPFHEAGLVGLDVAMVGDAWGVHTTRDRVERLEAGGLQHMGDATLATTRALASGRTSLARDPERAVYYDLLGYWMVAYPLSVARVLAIVALVAFALLLLSAWRAGVVSLRGVLAACGWSCLGLVAGVLAALVPALVLKLLLHRSLGWFASPALVLACFALPAAAGMLFVQGRWRARALRKLDGDAERVALTAWMGSLVFWSVWLLVATIGGAGTGYIALFWVAGGAVGLLVAALFRRARLLGAIIGLIPGALVTIEVATLVVANVVPMVGIPPASVPSDMVVAVLVALATGLVGVVAGTVPLRGGGFGRAAAVCAVLGLVGIAVTALQPPYSAARPKRLLAGHTADAGKGALLLAGPGPDGMRPLTALLPDATLAPASWPALDGMMAPFTHLLPAPEPAMPAPRAEVTRDEHDPATDTRQVTLHLYGTSPQLRLFVPAEPLVGWSVTPSLGAVARVDGRYPVLFEGVPPGGVDVSLTLRGTRPVEVELRGIDGYPATGPEIEALGRRLPDWVALTAYSYRTTRVTIDGR